MASSTAVHGNSILPGTGVTVEYTPVGAVIRPSPAGAGSGSFLCSIPNPAGAPVTADSIKIDNTRDLTNVTDVQLYSGNALVSTTDVPTTQSIGFPLVFSNAAVGNDDAGWCLVVTVEFKNPASSITVYSLSIQFP